MAAVLWPLSVESTVQCIASGATTPFRFEHGAIFFLSLLEEKLWAARDPRLLKTGRRKSFRFRFRLSTVSESESTKTFLIGQWISRSSTRSRCSGIPKSEIEISDPFEDEKAFWRLGARTDVQRVQPRRSASCVVR